MNKIINEDTNYICNNDLDWGKFKNANIIVTGATGMIGSYMVYTLLNLNELYDYNIKIYAVCRDIEKFEKVFSSCSIFKLFPKIIDLNKINKIHFQENIHYIFHTASPADSNLYYNDPLSVIEPNVIGTRNLLELAKAQENFKGFLFLSSGEVTGQIKTHNTTIEEDEYGYLDPTDVRSCYGESKRLAENLCKCYSHQYGLHTISVRPEHTFGPSMDLKTDKRVFAEFVLNIINNEDIIIKSDGKSVRTFTYLTDAVDGFFRALLNGTSGESYNVSNNNNRISIKDLALLFINDLYSNKNLKMFYKKRNDTNNYLENKNKIQPSLSTKKIEQLGYKAKIDLITGFSRTINSFIKD